MSDSARERAAAKITRLASQPGDLVTFWRSCTEVIAGVVPYYWTPCWFTLDPASLLITSHFHEGMPRIPAEWLAEEYYGDDVNKLADVARSDTGLCTLHEATGGDPSGSPRWQRNMQLGGDQELIARLRAKSGEVWGALGLYREPGQPSFDDADKHFLRAVAPHLAEGARRALLVGEATDPEGPGAPGLLILTDRWEIDSTTPVSNAGWLSSLTVTGRPATSRRPSSPWPAGPCAHPQRPVSRARSRYRASCPAQAPGSSCTEPALPPPARAGWPSSSNRPTPPASTRC